MKQKIQKWPCYHCNKLMIKPYRINIFFRDPSRRYSGSGLPVIHTENRQYCKTHYQEAIKRLEKAL